MSQFMLFTDGGAFANKEEYFDGVSAFRLLRRDAEDLSKSKLIMEYADITDQRTMAFAEIHAIEIGLDRLYHHVLSIDKKERAKHNIIVFTDSMNCRMTLTTWIKAWLKISRKKNDGKLYNTSNQEVKNVKEIVFAYKRLLEIEQLGVQIRLVHIHSHITKSTFKETHTKFCVFNGCSITEEEFGYYALQNKLCDKLVNSFYAKVVKGESTDVLETLHEKDFKTNTPVVTSTGPETSRKETTGDGQPPVKQDD